MSFSHQAQCLAETVIGIEDVNRFGRAVFYVVRFRSRLRKDRCMQKITHRQPVNLADYATVLDSGFGTLPPHLVQRWCDTLG